MQRNIVQVNRHGEIEVSKNEVQYKIPIARTDVEELSEIEDHYEQFAQSLLQYDNYVFAHDIQTIRHQFIFTYELKEMRAYHYIRQLSFEEQVHYFQSLANLAQNDVPILWDKKALYLDLTDKKVKSLIFEFPSHPIYSHQTALDGLVELILLGLTNLKRVLGKPRKTDFIRQEDDILRFAENIIHAKSIEDIEAIIHEKLVDIEKEKELKEEAKQNKPIYTFVANMKEKRQSAKDNKPQETKPKKEKTSWLDSKATYVGAAVLGAGLLMASMGGAFESTASEDEEQDRNNTEEEEQNSNPNTEEANNEQQTPEEETVSEEDVSMIYREMTINDDPEQAIERFNNIGYERLPDEDQSYMLDLLRDNDLAVEAIELEEDYANVIAEDRDEEEIASIAEESGHPRIQFAASYFQGEWEDMQTLGEDLELSEDEQVMMDIADAELELEALVDDDADDDDIEEVEDDIADLQSSLEG